MAGRKSQTAPISVGVAGIDQFAGLSQEEREKRVHWAPVWCGGYDVNPETGEREYHHFTGKLCKCPPGPQIQALLTDAREIALGGGRGSGKTEVEYGFILKGNPTGDDPVDVSYINAPDYKFLVVRQTVADLDDWFGRAHDIFGPLGAKLNDSDYTITFPSGAWGVCGHLQDEQSYKKHQGKEKHRIIIEEATQLRSEKLLMRFLLSLRSKNPKLRPQAMLTANPDGPGLQWFRARYINLNHADGRPVQRGEKWEGLGPRLSRVYIKSTIYDNPYLLANDPAYVADLEALPPGERERWLEGDFDVVEGAFYPEFRSDGPKWGRDGKMEPETARHVIPAGSVELQHWWPRAISGDIGYGHRSAFYWGCWHPKKQLHVYREYSVSRVGMTELGCEVALRTLPDLQAMPDPHITLFISHDAFARDNDAPTFAEQIAAGIAKVLGKDAAFVYSFTPEEELMDTREAWASVERRRKMLASRTNITIARAPKNTAAAASLLRELLRWWPLAKSTAEPDMVVAKRIHLEQGALAWKQYMDSFEQAKAEVLPGIQIWDCCPRLVEGMKAAQRDPNKPDNILSQEGDDEVDSLQYLTSSFRFTEAQMPKDVYVSERLKQLSGAPTDQLVMAARFAENEYDGKRNRGHGFTIPRIAGPTLRHRVN